MNNFSQNIEKLFWKHYCMTISIFFSRNIEKKHTTFSWSFTKINCAVTVKLSVPSISEQILGLFFLIHLRLFSVSYMFEQSPPAKQSVYQVYGLLGFAHNVTNQPQLVFKYLTNSIYMVVKTQNMKIIQFAWVLFIRILHE